MSNKTTFKRVALAMVAALGFGVLASGPSSAVVQSHTLAFDTNQAATGTAKVGETATVRVKSSFTALASGDSVTVLGVLVSKPSTSGKSGTMAFTTDSSTATPAATAASGYTASAIPGPASMVFQYSITELDVAGTYVIDFFGVGSNGTNPAKLTYTLTVTAANTKPAAAQSSAWIQGIGGRTAYDNAITADSAISVAETTSAVATIVMQQRNSDSQSSTILVPESVLVTVSGVGAVKVNGGGNNVGIALIKPSDTISVVGDARTGVQTITLTTASMTTWKSFTVTYTGVATKATMTAPFSVMSASAPAATRTLRVVPRDAGDNLVTSGALNLFVHSSDTRVVANGTSAIACTAATVALGYGTCEIPTALFLDSGTANITLGTFAAGTTPAATDYATNSVAITVSGSPAKVAIAFEKRSYRPGEAAKLTVTVTDGAGRPVADQTIVSLFTTGGITVTPAGQGTVNAETITTVAATHGQGKLTYTYTMPTTAGEVVASATGHTGLTIAANRVAVADTVTVVDPAEEAATSALDAATSAADAAIEAGEAATLAQEAADTAAQAAQDAQATAQAAVDAVTTLSGEVTKLVAQLATLQKLINRIARKVGVRVR